MSSARVESLLSILTTVKKSQSQAKVNGKAQTKRYVSMKKKSVKKRKRKGK